MGGHHKNKYLSTVGSEIKILKAKGSKKKECAQKTNKNVRTVPLSLQGFYAEQISVSVTSAGPIAWSWK